MPNNSPLTNINNQLDTQSQRTGSFPQLYYGDSGLGGLEQP
jgi:hypothetical protein